MFLTALLTICKWANTRVFQSGRDTDYRILNSYYRNIYYQYTFCFLSVKCFVMLYFWLVQKFCTYKAYTFLYSVQVRLTSLVGKWTVCLNWSHWHILTNSGSALIEYSLSCIVTLCDLWHIKILLLQRISAYFILIVEENCNSNSKQ